MKNVCVVLPTYNERENIEDILKKIFEAVPGIFVLVEEIKKCGKGNENDLTLDSMRRAKASGVEVIELTRGSHRVPVNEL